MERQEKKTKINAAACALAAITALYALSLGVLHRVVPAGGEASYEVVVQTETALPTAPERVLVDVNTASLDELDALTGIGPALAQAIVDERTANGPFKSAEDLLRVKGIGEAKLEGFRGEITVGGAAETEKEEADEDSGR